MRVVFVTTVFDDVRTGPAVYAHYLWEAFRDDLEIDFHVVAPRFAEQHPKCHSSGVGPGELGFFRALCRKTAQVVGADTAATLIHTNNCHTGLSLLRLGVPVIGQVNDYENVDIALQFIRYWRLYGPKRCAALLWRRRLERNAVCCQALTLCNSDFTRGKILAAYRPPRPERIRTLYKAVDLSGFRRPDVLPPDPLQRRQGPSRLLFIGSDFRRKGLDTLVEAMNLLPEARLDVIGVGPPEFAAAFPRLSSKASPDRVLFHGPQPRALVPHALWHSDAFVMPSRAEALGVVILEALAADLPVVATPVGGIPEIMTAADCGEMVPPDDAARLAEAVKRVVLANRDRASVRPAVERILDKFSKNAMVGSLRKTYRELGRQTTCQ